MKPRNRVPNLDHIGKKSKAKKYEMPPSEAFGISRSREDLDDQRRKLDALEEHKAEVRRNRG